MSNGIAVPEGWEVQPLAECVDVLDSQRKPVNAKERAGRVGSVPYFGATGQVGWIDDYLFNEELVLVGEDGAPFLDKSKQIAYIINGKSWVNNHAHVLRARSAITSNRYVKHYLDSFDFTHYVQGSTRDKLTQGSMNSIPVPLPSKDVQDAIVVLIDRIAQRRSEADSHLAGARRAIDRLRSAVFAAACSGRLTEDWRAEHPKADARQEVAASREAVGSLTKKPLTRDGWSEPDWLALPEQWQWVPMSELSVIRGGIQKQPKRAPKKNAYPYLRVANVLRGRLDLSALHNFELFEGELETYRLQAGDLLVVEGNGSASEIGRAAVWRDEVPDCVHQNHIIRARFPVIEPDFAAMYWNSPIGAREISKLAVTSSGLYSLSVKKIAAVPVPVAPLAEQREVVRRTKALLHMTDQLAGRVRRASVAVGRTSQAVLTRAFRGDLGGGGVA